MMQISKRKNKSGNNRVNNVSTQPYLDGDMDWQQSRTSIVRFPGLMMPDRFVTKLKYAETFRLLNAAATGQQIFRGNSCYDPDQTGVGGQPMGFDQFAIFYNKYRVRASTLTFNLIRTSESVRITITPSNSFSVPASVATALENPYNRLIDISSSISNFSNSTRMPTYKIWGVDPTTVSSEDNFAATVTADPTNVWAWVLNVATYDGIATATLWVDLAVIYEVEFFDRYPIARS
jgi:hypothetical protein